MSLEKLWALSDKAYDSRVDIRNRYTKVIQANQTLADTEQNWVDQNLNPILELMGD